MSSLLESGTSSYHKYNLLLRHHSKRKLSNQNDAVNAMAGLLTRLAKQMGYKVLEGLPTACFDASLTFFKDGGGSLERRGAFPSYSWAGWIGSVSMSEKNTEVCGSVKTWL